MSINVQKRLCKVALRVRVKVFSVLICYSALCHDCMQSMHRVFLFSNNKSTMVCIIEFTKQLSGSCRSLFQHICLDERHHIPTRLAVRTTRKYSCQYEALVENISFLIQTLGSVYFTSNWELENGPKVQVSPLMRWASLTQISFFRAVFPPTHLQKECVWLKITRAANSAFHSLPNGTGEKNRSTLLRNSSL